MPNITEPLRLAVGPHAAGSGKGCAMNVISWENGDTTITDLPACADAQLALFVQWANDSYCEHRDWQSVDSADLLCPPCSAVILDLAHRTVGTALDNPHRALRARKAATAVYDRHLWDPALRIQARLGAAHAAIDAFEEVAGIKAAATAPEVTERAYAQMVGVA